MSFFRSDRHSLKLVFVLLFASITINAQPTSLDRPTLLIFSGSDWCIPCIRFDRDVRQDPEFISFTKKRLNVLIADFPQHAKLDKETVHRNEELAEKYNPNGLFPLVLLLDESGKIISEVSTNKVSAQQVIGEINRYLPSTVVKEFQTSAILMGSAFQITLVTDEAQGDALLEACVNKIASIEAWLSSWDEESITTTLNSRAGIEPIGISKEYYNLLVRCRTISELTQGAFDISFRGLGELYQFDKGEHELPSSQELESKLDAVGFQFIDLSKENSCFFRKKELAIGFGAIGKGYAAEQAKKLMMDAGVSGGVINASGDLTTWGRRSNGEPWNVGIPNPKTNQEILLWLPLDNKAIATSGDYEKYFTHNGKVYSHIINPKTGYPVVGSRSVSVISSNAELSDALATAVAVLGAEIGLDLINQIPDAECVFIDNNLKLHFSNGLKTYEN